MNIVRRFHGDACYPVAAGVPGGANPTGLVIPPSAGFAFGGGVYDCSEEGLYRFWNTSPSQAVNRIVYQEDAHALLSGLSWLAVHGKADNALGVSGLLSQMMSSAVRTQCEPISDFVKAILDSLPNLAWAPTPIPCRKVRVLTAETPNGYFDGHVMVEAKIGQTWSLYDINGHVTYGGGVSLREAVPLLPARSIDPIADDDIAGELSGGSFNVTCWRKLTMRTTEQKREQMQRVMQIPGIVHGDGLTYFYLPSGTESRQAWVLGLNAGYRILSKEAWDTQFYS
jgi:hypothetical protein